MVETQFHYIAQEAVTNAIRHGRAKRVGISLKKRKGLFHLAVRDDGAGLPAGHDSFKGMGLRIMRYRANAIGGSLTTALLRTVKSCGPDSFWVGVKSRGGEAGPTGRGRAIFAGRR